MTENRNYPQIVTSKLSRLSQGLNCKELTSRAQLLSQRRGQIPAFLFLQVSVRWAKENTGLGKYPFVYTVISVALWITLRISHMRGKLSYPWTTPSINSASLFPLTNGLFHDNHLEKRRSRTSLAGTCRVQTSWILHLCLEKPFLPGIGMDVGSWGLTKNLGSLLHQLLKAFLRCPMAEFWMLALLPDSRAKSWDNRPSSLVGCLKQTGWAPTL